MSHPKKSFSLKTINLKQRNKTGLSYYIKFKLQFLQKLSFLFVKYTTKSQKKS